MNTVVVDSFFFSLKLFAEILFFRFYVQYNNTLSSSDSLVVLENSIVAAREMSNQSVFYERKKTRDTFEML